MFQVQAQISGVQTLKGNTLKIAMETQDISTFTPEELSEIFLLNEKLVWVAFKEQPVNSEEVEEKKPVSVGDNPKDKKQTPSQRLRSVLYIYWEQSGQKQDFDTFYANQMEKIIDYIKSKLY